MTLDEAVALLREARDFMRQAAISRGPCPDCTECDYRDAIIAKADAALAEHDAVPPSEEKVEWIPNGPRGLSGYLKGRVEKASAYQTKDGLWWASASDIGPFDTLDEAQRAALAAARGMR